jgi:predicted transcriptional regulator
MAMTSVRIPDDLMVRLQKTAEQRRRSKSWLINDAVREYLEREEIRARRLAETRQALAEVDKGQLIEGDEVLDWLDSWGTEDEKAPPK